MHALFAVLCGLFQCREEVRFSVGKADFGKLVGGKAERARAQHRDERNILMRIVDNRKQAHERGYLRRAKEAASLPCRNGYAAQDKLAAIGLAHRVCRAHEQRDIPVAERAAVYRHARVHEFKDLLGNGGGLLFGLAAQIVLVGAHVDEDKLRSHALIVVNAAAFKLRVFVVIDLAELFGHACRENAVYTVDDLAARAEVFLEHDLHRLALTRIGQKCVFFVFIGEYQRVGKAETVDRLLHVADHKQVAPVLRQGAKYLVLNGVYVLILIDHYLAKARAGFARKGCRASVLIRQKLGGKVLKVCKIHLCPAALFGAVGSVKAQGQLDERAHGRRRGTHVAQELFAVVREHFREFFAVLFAKSAHLLYVFEKLGVWRIQKPAERWEAYGQLLPRPVPAEGARARERAQRKRGIRAARTVFFGDDLVFGRSLANIVHPLRPVLRRGADLLEDLRAPDGFSCVIGVGFYCLQLRAQPLCRASVALRFAVQRKHGFRKAIVAAPGPHRVGKELKALVGRFIALIEHALDNALLYRLRSVLLYDLELR